MVTSAAVNRSMSVRKLLKNDLNFEVSFVISCSFLSKIFLLFWYWTAKSHKVFRALSKLGLISKVSIDRGKICSWVVQFLKIGIPSSSIVSLKKFMKAIFIVKYISKSVFVSEPLQTASNSKRKLLLVSTSQLHKILLFIRMYGWLGMFIRMLLLCEHITFYRWASLPKWSEIHHQVWWVLCQFCCNSTRIHSFPLWCYNYKQFFTGIFISNFLTHFQFLCMQCYVCFFI